MPEKPPLEDILEGKENQSKQEIVKSPNSPIGSNIKEKQKIPDKSNKNEKKYHLFNLSSICGVVGGGGIISSLFMNYPDSEGFLYWGMGVLFIAPVYSVIRYFKNKFEKQKLPLDNLIEQAEKSTPKQQIKLYKKAIKLDPTNGNLHHLLGGAHHDLRNYIRATWAYKKAVNLKPNNPQHHRNLGIIFKKRGKYAPAADQFMNAINLDMDYKECYDLAIECLEELSWFKEAIPIYEIMIQRGLGDKSFLNEKIKKAKIEVVKEDIVSHIKQRIGSANINGWYPSPDRTKWAVLVNGNFQESIFVANKDGTNITEILSAGIDGFVGQRQDTFYDISSVAWLNNNSIFFRGVFNYNPQKENNPYTTKSPGIKIDIDKQSNVRKNMGEYNA